MKIHPRKKLPRIFPLFSLHSCLRGRQKKKHAKSIVGLRVCVCMCVSVCEGVCGWWLGCLFRFRFVCKTIKSKRVAVVATAAVAKATCHLPLTTCHLALQRGAHGQRLPRHFPLLMSLATLNVAKSFCFAHPKSSKKGMQGIKY